jgi:hypothetical protein
VLGSDKWTQALGDRRRISAQRNIWWRNVASRYACPVPLQDGVFIRLYRGRWPNVLVHTPGYQLHPRNIPYNGVITTPQQPSLATITPTSYIDRWARRGASWWTDDPSGSHYIWPLLSPEVAVS